MAIGPTIAMIGSAAFFGAIAAGAVYYELQEQRRQRKLWADWARRRDWTHTDHSRIPADDLVGEPFDKGRYRIASNVISGTWAGLPVAFFHYLYVTGAGKTQKTHHRSVVQYATDANFPELTVHQGRRIRLTGDIQFESDTFNDRFDVRCADERFAFQIVHPLFIRALLDGALKGSHLTIAGGRVTVWCEAHVPSRKVDGLLTQLAAMVRLIPAHTWRDHGVAPPTVTSDGHAPA